MRNRVFTTSLKLTITAILSLALLSACSSKPSDPFSDYKNQSAASIFHKGERHLAKHDYKEATSDFEALDGLYPFGDYTKQGQLDIIYAYYKNDDKAIALAAAQRYIRLYPRDKNVDYAYFMQGLTNFEMGGGWLQNKLGMDRSSRDISNYKSAYDSFAIIDKRFPRSLYAEDSYSRMRFIRNLIAKHEYDIAKFYWKRQAYVAAANRASYIIQHFQGAPEVVPAFGMLIRADRKLELNAQAQQNLYLLRYNYPNSKTARSF